MRTNTVKTMQSKFAGTCTKCAKPIAKGETIGWSKATGAMHASCAGIYIPTPPQDIRAKCWTCGTEGARARHWSGGFYCDTCHEVNKSRPLAPDITDIMYEDQCAAACGFGL